MVGNWQVVSSGRGPTNVEQAEAARRDFDLSGGALCLDFANTLDDRPDPRAPSYWREPAERKTSRARLLRQY